MLNHNGQKWALHINKQNIVTEGKIKLFLNGEIDVGDEQGNSQEIQINESDRERVIEEITAIVTIS